MRVAAVCLLCALWACTETVGLDEERDPGLPDEIRFDSVAWNCHPIDTLPNGMVLLGCN